NEFPTSLMAGLLSPGVRRLPSSSDPVWAVAAAGTADGGEANHPDACQLNVPDHVVNGTFDVSDPASDQFGWHTMGSVAVVGGAGVLIEDSTYNSRLSQTFLVPAGATSLLFTFHLEG